MTKVIGINCHKWWMVTKISLWALTTIGLGYIAYIGYDNSFGNGRMFVCFVCARELAEEADILIEGSTPSYE